MRLRFWRKPEGPDGREQLARARGQLQELKSIEREHRAVANKIADRREKNHFSEDWQAWVEGSPKRRAS